MSTECSTSVLQKLHRAAELIDTFIAFDYAIKILYFPERPTKMLKVNK